MLQLAQNYPAGFLSLNQIAKDQEISLKYLEQVMTPLKRAGLVKGLRGAGGGYLLKKNPSKISLVEIIQTLEGTLTLTDCVDDKRRCRRSNQCGTRDTWVYLHRVIYNALDSVRLQDLVNDSLKKGRATRE